MIASIFNKIQGILFPIFALTYCHLWYYQPFPPEMCEFLEQSYQCPRNTGGSLGTLVRFHWLYSRKVLWIKTGKINVITPRVMYHGISEPTLRTGTQNFNTLKDPAFLWALCSNFFPFFHINGCRMGWKKFRHYNVHSSIVCAELLLMSTGLGREKQV